MIERFALGAKILICVLAGFMVLMAFDVFEIDASIWERIGGFFISSIPSIIMVLFVVVFWNKEKILAFACFGIALAWTIFLIFKGNFPDMFGGVLIVDIPLALSGAILLISSKKLKE